MAYRYYYKDYELSDGLVYSANLLAQSAVLNFTDVAAEDTLCGLGIGHAFNLNQNSIFGMSTVIASIGLCQPHSQLQIFLRKR